MTRNDINLSSPEFLSDPYPVYHHIREIDPVFWMPHTGPTGGMWLVTRYADVAAVLKDARLSKDVSRIAPADELTPLDHAMLGKDPPDHTRLRSLAAQAFTPKRIADLEPRIADIVDDLLAPVRANGTLDFIAEFALPLPIIVIAELLGVPPEDRNTFRSWSNDIVRGADAVQGSEENARKGQEASIALAGYFRDLIQERRRDPRRDLISGLIEARDAQDRLNETELLGTCILLLIAGHETTVNLLGNGLLALLRHPDQRTRLQRRPEHIPAAVEEMLRFDSPVQRATFRIATETTAIGGKPIKAGQQVSAVIGAANRDPTQFPDPDRFDVTREPNRHLAFGLGIHFCLGAPLARTEARIAFSRIFEKLPNIQLAVAEPAWNANTFLRGLKSLAVTC